MRISCLPLCLKYYSFFFFFLFSFLFLPLFSHISYISHRNFIYSQTSQLSSGRQVRPPSDFLTEEMITNWEERLSPEQGDFRNLEKEIRAPLKKYYEQFTEQKKIYDEIKNIPQPPYKIGTSHLRRFLQKKDKSIAKSYFIQSSPYLFRSHVALATAYGKQSRAFQAIGEYAMAFRYVALEPLSIEEEKQIQKIQKNLLTYKKNEIADVPGKNYINTVSEAEKEECYVWMKKIFADEKRLLEENDEKWKGDANIFRQDLENYFIKKKAHKEAIRQVSVTRDKAARGKNVSIQDAKNTEGKFRREREALASSLEGIRKDSYKNYIDRLRLLYGKAAYDMALQVKKLEKESKSYQEKKYRSSFLRGLGNRNFLDKKTLDTHLKGYSIFLELAHKINPFMLEYIRLLSDEKYRSKKTKQAIFFTELYIRGAQDALYLEKKENINKPSEKELALYTLRLAKLYTDHHRHFQSAENYENYLYFISKLPQEKEKEMAVINMLADLYFKKLGKLEKAKILYKDYIEKTKDYANNKNELFREVHRYKALSNLASIDRENQNKEEEKKYLKNTQIEYAKIEQKKENLNKELVNLIEEKEKLKKELLQKEDDNTQKKYYLLTDKIIPEKKKVLDTLLFYTKTLQHPKSLERLAYLAQTERSWSEAASFYKQILEIGSSQQVTRARKNLNALRLRQENGYFPQSTPELEPSFDR